MPEKLRFEGKPVVLLLGFGGSFRAGMDGTIVQKDLKICIILIHITDARRGGHMIRAEPVRTLGKFCGALMSTLEQHIAQIANLIAQLRELNQLRERVRKAELAGRSRQVGRRKRTLIRRLAPSLNRSGNHRSFSRR